MLKTLKRKIALVAVTVVGASGLAVIAAPVANAADALPTSVTGTVAPTRPGDQATMSVVLGFALSTDTPAATGVLRARLLSGPVGADGTTAASIGADTVTTAAVRGIATAVDTTAYTVTAPLVFTPNNAGAYQLLVWYDATNNAATAQYPAAATPQGVVSFTTAGQPRSISWTAAAKTGSTDTSTATIFNFTLKDVNANTTYLKAGENITASVTDSSGASGTIYAADTTTVFGAGAAAYSAPFGVAVAKATAPSGNIGVVASAAGTVTVSALGTGLLSGLVPAATATLTTRAEIYATKFKVTNTTSITTVNNATTATNATTLPTEQVGAAAATVYASRSKSLAMNFRVTAAAAGTIRATVAAIDANTLLPTGVTAGTVDVTIASDGATAPTYTGTLAVTATAATAGSGYVISVPVTSSTVMKYTVIYGTPTASNTLGYVTVEPLADNTATIVRVLQAGTANFTATVYDQYGDVVSGASVTWTVTGRNAGSAASTTNDKGVATFALKDASTATLTASPTDAVAVQAASASANSFTGAVTTTVRYGTTITATTLTLANDAPTAATFRLIDSATVLTATAKDAVGIGISGLGITFTLPDGAYTTTAGASTTVYTNGSGVATLSIKSTKTGVNSAGASGGGLTATASTWTVQNQSAIDPRTISLAPATVSVAGGAIVRVVATVKDRYGNPVSGVTVTPSYAGTAGRIQAVGGAIASTATTGTDGTVGIDLGAIGSEAGTGTLTATMTGGDATADGSTMGNAATIPARAASATAAVTITAAAAAANPALDAVKTDVKAVSDTVATLSKAVTTIQSSVTELTTSFTAQIKSLSSAIAKISRAIAALSKKIK